MLQRKAVKRTTLELLIQLMQDGQLTDFILVGGTALALQVGHRDSIDLDLFTKHPFDASELDRYLSSFLSLNDMQKAYSHKYPNSNPIMVPKALSYHRDINLKEPIKMIAGRLKWVLIEKRLMNMIDNPAKVFSHLNMLES